MAKQQGETKTPTSGQLAGARVAAGQGSHNGQYKPAALRPQPPNGKRPILVGNIPDELKAEQRWVCWRFAGRGKKKTKVPVQLSGYRASSTDPDTWTTFDAALAASARFDGLGFVLGDGYLGVDLDHCYAPDGALSELAASIVAQLDTYTERSPSGDGLHLIAKGELPGEDIPSNPIDVEMYDGERYFTITGDHLEGSPLTIEERSDQIAAVHAEVQELLLPVNPFADLVTTPAALASREPPPADWVIKGLLERLDLALLTGKAGDMKSLFLMFMLIRQSLGLKVLTREDGTGGLPTKPMSWLWVNTDNSQNTHEERQLAICRSLGRFDAPIFSVTSTSFELSNPQHVKWIAALAADVGAEGLVLDTLSGALLGVNENSAEEMTLPAAHLRSLSNAGLTVIAIHHPPKADPDGARGSSVLEGKVDRRLVVSRERDLLTIKQPKLRSRGVKQITAIAALEIDPLNEALLGVAFFDGQKAQADEVETEIRSKVREILDANGELSKNALHTKVKGRWEALKNVLASMVVSREIALRVGPRNAQLYSLIEKP